MDGQMLKCTTDDADEELWFNEDQHDLILGRWYALVSDYARRSLTFEKDLFPAIAGLAEIVHYQIDSDYIAGIWNVDVERGLLWRLNQNGKEPQSYHAPSWSWAALQVSPSAYGVIGGRDDQDLYPTVTRFQARSFTSNIGWLKFHPEACVQKSSGFHVPPPEGSYLQLSCNISPALNSPMIGDPPFCNLPNRQWNTYSPVLFLNCWIDGKYGDNQKQGPKMGQIVCDFDIPTTKKEINPELFVDISYAWIASVPGDGKGADGEPTFPHEVLWCLMLKKFGEGDEGYKRVGFAQIPRSDKLTSLPWKVRTIKIF